MQILNVENLKMYFLTLRGWVKAVDDVSFTLEKGAALGLAGESGCGKTSTALCVLRLLPRNGKIFGGKINFEGKDIVKLGERELRREIRWKKISTIFQGAMNALHPTIKVGDQIIESITTHENISKKEAKKRAESLLDLVGIGASRIDRYPHELSGGMKQRVIIAMSLACNPDLVIADEPTTALDVIIEAQVLKVMKDLQHKLNLSMILISHDLSMIAETCDKVAIMYAGKIVEQGDTTSIYKEPLHPYTQKLVSAFPSIVGPKKELSSIHGFPPDLLNPPTGCRFHPRCNYAMEICRKVEPPTVFLGNKNHGVACHLISGEKS
jgi:peptide/nickel transport system ATP-binding protein